MNEKTIQYITKYITKEDIDHPEFIGKVLCVKSLCNIAQSAGDVISLFKKPIQKVGEKVFEELFDAKGQSKGFKEIFKDFKME